MKRRPLILASIAAFLSGLFGKPLAARPTPTVAKPDPNCYGGGSITLGGKRYVWKVSSPREYLHPDTLAELLDPNRIFPHPNPDWFDTKREVWVLAKDEPDWRDLTTFKIEPYEPDENGSDMERRMVAEKKADYANIQPVEQFHEIRDFRERRFAEIANEIGYKEIEDEFNYDRRAINILKQVNAEADLFWPNKSG